MQEIMNKNCYFELHFNNKFSDTFGIILFCKILYNIWKQNLIFIREK